jgi:hypothetical protein
MQSYSFKRLIVGLSPGMAERSIEIAAELAGRLHLELIGLFVEDPALRHLANLPFVREFQPLGGGWHPIDVEKLSQDLDLAIRSAERMFAEAARRVATKYQFEVLRRSATETITAISQAGDIVVIIEPASAMERAARQIFWFAEAAFRSTAAVMLAPPRIARIKGPVVAIATALDDPSIRAAAAIATMVQEELIIVQTYEGEGVCKGNLTIKYLAVGRGQPIYPADCSDALRPLSERLVVISRGPLAQAIAATIVSIRRVPVLIVEPSREATIAGLQSEAEGA